jgi:hypothetical protein
MPGDSFCLERRGDEPHQAWVSLAYATSRKREKWRTPITEWIRIPEHSRGLLSQ